MTTHRLEREQFLPYPVDRVFAFFAEARKLERLTPSWLSFEVLTPEPIVDHRQAREQALERVCAFAAEHSIRPGDGAAQRRADVPRVC